ncbi:tRNA1(Val) (adenine(37)-N6)-methyltransferase [Tumebacillus sp. ITR2]|uniref:tRNA1(Val) (Adenine(37)-N6)-methyltransferase n=1 Tax=Tumebacillus amylolyticus TaxID=2801339 RepID=A0ABS1JHA0_9BACL|nr:tRNA1(Val) (adenine(37)-N6)-methyltransferase [Tumebacillus amylolyticus]MBL0389053.1 tRNA1(Val) (adenine(37)-N6)-methyltransferase [Tumebacillus amylolyticus]
MEFDLKPGERLDDLQTKDLRIIQSDEVFSFSLDAVLLAHYVTLRNRDRVLDMGTGNGVIPLLLASRSELPRRAGIVGLEIQERLADMAQRNVSGNQLQETIEIVNGDLREAVRHFGHESFDVVTCNPPYRPAGIGDASLNPHVAIAKHEITAKLEDVVTAAAKLLKYQGKFAMVHRPDRLADIIALMKLHKLEPKRLLLVHPRAHLRPNILLIEAIKGGKPELRIDPPLFVHTDDGGYTQAILDIYAGRGEFAR